jgi:hypothetical protein
MNEPAKRTQTTCRDEHERPATTALSDQERAAICEAGADDARRSRARHGLPERIEDPAAVASSPGSPAGGPLAGMIPPGFAGHVTLTIPAATLTRGAGRPGNWPGSGRSTRIWPVS